MKLDEVIRAIGADVQGREPAFADTEVNKFVVDSRSATAGDVFFALSQPDYRNNGFNGDFDDATAFAAAALRSGAAACVLRRDRFEEHRHDLEPFAGRLLFVPDAIKALQDLASAVYRKWNKPVIAVTGSAGKTTAKELIASVIGASGRRVLKNIKNYNNGIGQPLTVLELAADSGYDIAVLEMGMSTPMNEIARLCRITPPDISVVLNVLPVHVEHLGSIENVAKAKAEIVEGMKEGGTAVLNADDDRVAAMQSLSRGGTLTFGIARPADVTASSIEVQGFGNTSFWLRTPSGEADVRFPLNGRHNIMNALAAAAAAHALGMAVEEIAQALGRVESPGQRGEVIHFPGGVTVINDSYNSNPTALLSMVETMIEGRGGHQRLIVVAGEMLELGNETAAIHAETGRSIAAKGIDALIGVRGSAADMVNAARAEGLSDGVFAVDSDAAGDVLVKMMRPGDLVLIKGSRGVRTEKVLEKINQHFRPEADTVVRSA